MRPGACKHGDGLVDPGFDADENVETSKRRKVEITTTRAKQRYQDERLIVLSIGGTQYPHLFAFGASIAVDTPKPHGLTTASLDRATHRNIEKRPAGRRCSPCVNTNEMDHWYESEWKVR